MVRSGSHITGRLLVHLLDLFRQPGSDDRPRTLNTFAGIRPGDMPAFIVAQLRGRPGRILARRVAFRGPAAFPAPGRDLGNPSVDTGIVSCLLLALPTFLGGYTAGTV